MQDVVFSRLFYGCLNSKELRNTTSKNVKLCVLLGGICHLCAVKTTSDLLLLIVGIFSY